VTNALGRPAWREIARPGGTHPVLPALLFVSVVALAGLTSLAVPEPLNGRVTLGVAVLALGTAYLIWPKPTLLTFALLMLLSRTLSHWIQPELSHLDELFLPFLVILAAVRTRPWRNVAWFSAVRDVALLAFLGVGIVSALLGGVPVAVWGFALLSTLKIFAFFYVVLWHEFRLVDIRQAIPMVLGFGLVVLLVAGLEALDPEAVRGALHLGDIGVKRASLPSVKSLLWLPGTFSWFATFIGLFLFAGYVVLGRWWLLVGGILFSVVTVLGARRRALTGLAVALGAGLATAIGRRGAERGLWRRWIPIGLAGAVVAILFMPSLFGLLRLTETELSDSGTARVAMYNASVRIASDHLPFGVGLGQFGSAASKNPYSPVYAEYGLDEVPGLTADDPSFVGDAYWPRILGETGIAGLVAMIVFVAALALSSWRAARATYGDPLLTAFVLGAWMALIQTLVETFASAMFDSPPRIYLLFGAVAAALCLRRATKRPDRAPVPAVDKASAVRATLVAVLAMTVVVGARAAAPANDLLTPEPAFSSVNGGAVFDDWPEVARQPWPERGQNGMPAGFVDDVLIGGLKGPTALRFLPDGRLLVAEQAGLVKIFPAADIDEPRVLLDVRDETLSNYQLGLLGLGVDPDFDREPYVYLLYTRDAQLGGQTPTYGSPGGVDQCPARDACPASGRLVRYRIEGEPAMPSGDAEVLIDDWCIKGPNHTVGGIAFAPDGALYVSGGDGGDGDLTDYGQLAEPTDVCVDPERQGGALHAQDLPLGTDPVGLAGTIARVDRATGEGLPDNPLANSADENARRIVGYGLRNPFRVAFRPGTGELWIGDVGWNKYEEIDRLPADLAEPVNFGWPCFEGPEIQPDWQTVAADACADLYANEAKVTFPRFSYRQGVGAEGACGSVNAAISGLVFYDGTAFPERFHGALFFADVEQRCLFVVEAGSDGQPDPSTIRLFAQPLRISDLVVGPDGAFYYAHYPLGEIRRISWQ